MKKSWLKYLLQGFSQFNFTQESEGAKARHKAISFFISGLYQKHFLYNLPILLGILVVLFSNLCKFFTEKNTFFFLALHSFLPLKELVVDFQQEISTNPLFNLYPNFFINGYIHGKWLFGLFTNRKVFYRWYSILTQKIVEQKGSPVKNKQWLSFLTGIKKKRRTLPIIPDFVCNLGDNTLAIRELFVFKQPLIGFLDSKSQIENFIFPIIGNQHSYISCEFLFEFFKVALSESFFHEQKFFYFLLLQKIQKIFNTSFKNEF